MGHNKPTKEILDLHKLRKHKGEFIRVSRKGVKYFGIVQNVQKNTFGLLHLEPTELFNEEILHHKSQFTNGKVMHYTKKYQEVLLDTLLKEQNKMIKKYIKHKPDEIETIDMISNINYEELITSYFHKK